MELTPALEYSRFIVLQHYKFKHRCLSQPRKLGLESYAVVAKFVHTAYERIPGYR